MASTHNIQKGKTITFKTFKEIQVFADKHKPADNEFKLVGLSPFKYLKVN